MYLNEVRLEKNQLSDDFVRGEGSSIDMSIRIGESSVIIFLPRLLICSQRNGLTDSYLESVRENVGLREHLGQLKNSC